MNTTHQRSFALASARTDPCMDKLTNWRSISAQLANFSHDGAASWQAYLRRLYRSQSTVRLRLADVDMAYLDAGAVVGDVFLPPYCPAANARTPYFGSVVHAPRQAVWFQRSAPFAPVPNASWAEVTHCAGARHEYVARKSNA